MARLRAAVILSALCLIAAGRPDIYRAAGVLPEAPTVPLVALLARPAEYDGRLVRVEGFLTLHFEESALYPDKEAYEGGLASSSVWVNTPSGMDRAKAYRTPARYAAVLGRFVAGERGHMGRHSGALEDVQLIAPTLTRQEYERWLIEDQYRMRDDPRVWILLALTALVPFGVWRVATWNWKR
jgi:hypothetical protein